MIPRDNGDRSTGPVPLRCLKNLFERKLPSLPPATAVTGPPRNYGRDDTNCIPLDGRGGYEGLRTVCARLLSVRREASRRDGDSRDFSQRLHLNSGRHDRRCQRSNSKGHVRSVYRDTSTKPSPCRGEALSRILRENVVYLGGDLTMDALRMIVTAMASVQHILRNATASPRDGERNLLTTRSSMSSSYKSSRRRRRSDGSSVPFTTDSSGSGSRSPSTTLPLVRCSS